MRPESDNRLTRQILSMKNMRISHTRNKSNIAAAPQIGIHVPGPLHRTTSGLKAVLNH